MINQTLNNRYKVLAQLGKGAMGKVYRAHDRQTKQDVALKVIAHDLAPDREMLERFRREGSALRQLRHANIVAFVDMFVHQGQQVIVMEYMPGGSLHTLIRRGALPAVRAREIALDLCDALIHAHRLGIIHRDIKPENVLLAEDGTPKLTDFGVARLLATNTRLTGTGTQVGTPYYMSPEAWEGKPLDAQADVWSLGVVLFEMLTGQVPFAGDTAAAVMTKVLMTPPPDLLTLSPDVPQALVKIVEHALARDKAERYLTMRQMSAELELCALAAPARPWAPTKEKPALASPLETAPRRETPPPSPPLAGDGSTTRAFPKEKSSPWLKRAWVIGASVIALLIVGGLITAGGVGAWAFNNTQARLWTTQTAAAIAALPTTTSLPSETSALPTTPPHPSATRVRPTGTPEPSVTPALPTSTPRPSVTSVRPTGTLTPASSATEGAIEGHVYWINTGLAAVKVKVCTQWLFSCQTKEYSVTSDSDGHYLIANLPPGQYAFITKMTDQQDETRWPPNDPNPWIITVTAGQTSRRDVSVFKHDLKLSSPAYGATLSGSTPMLTWKAYPGATRYQVAAGRAPNNGQYISHEITTATQYVVTNPIGSGETCYWSVVAYSDQGTLAISQTYQFTVGP
jgi:serine/threonine-protein kinase